MEVAPGGGSDAARHRDPGAEGVLFTVEGELTVTHRPARPTCCSPGGYAFIPPGSGLDASATTAASRRGLPLDPQGLRAGRGHRGCRQPLVVNEARREEHADAGHRRRAGRRRASSTTSDMRHDMHVTIVTLEPGAVIPFAETHVMEHGLYVLEGKGGLQAQPRLGRGRGRRLHVAARLLPAGLLRRRARPLPLPALQGRQPAHRSCGTDRRRRSLRYGPRPAAGLACAGRQGGRGAMGRRVFRVVFRAFAVAGLLLGPAGAGLAQVVPADGSVLPFPPAPMAGVAAPRLQDSTMIWPRAAAAPAEGRAEYPDRAARRRRLRRLRDLRRRGAHPDARPAGGRGHQLQRRSTPPRSARRRAPRC